VIIENGSAKCAPKARLNANHPVKGLCDVTISDFWSWAYSDLACNTVRSVFAEYIIAQALGLTSAPRMEWTGVDFVWRGKKIEVKSAAFLQSWPQKKHSTVRFDVSIRKGSWDPETGVTTKVDRRQADCYVFCLHDEKDGAKANVADLGQWRFFVLPTWIINERFNGMRSVSLKFLEEQSSAVDHGNVRERIQEALFEQDRSHAKT